MIYSYVKTFVFNLAWLALLLHPCSGFSGNKKSKLVSEQSTAQQSAELSPQPSQDEPKNWQLEALRAVDLKSAERYQRRLVLQEVFAAENLENERKKEEKQRELTENEQHTQLQYGVENQIIDQVCTWIENSHNGFGAVGLSELRNLHLSFPAGHPELSQKLFELKSRLDKIDIPLKTLPQVEILSSQHSKILQNLRDDGVDRRVVDIIEENLLLSGQTTSLGICTGLGFFNGYSAGLGLGELITPLGKTYLVCSLHYAAISGFGFHGGIFRYEGNLSQDQTSKLILDPTTMTGKAYVRGSYKEPYKDFVIGFRGDCSEDRNVLHFQANKVYQIARDYNWIRKKLGMRTTNTSKIER